MTLRDAQRLYDLQAPPEDEPEAPEREYDPDDDEDVTDHVLDHYNDR
jgi:hypothetical protein